MQLIAKSSNLMNGNRVVDWGKGAGVNISGVRGHVTCGIKESIRCVAFWSDWRAVGCSETRRHRQNDAAGCMQWILCRKQGTRCGFDEACPPQNLQTVFVAGGVEAGCRHGLRVIRGAEGTAEVKADLCTDTAFIASAVLRVNSASVFVADSLLRQGGR